MTQKKSKGASPVTPEDIQLGLFVEGWRFTFVINQLFSLRFEEACRAALLKLKLRK